MNIEALAREAGHDAWDIYTDGRGCLRVSLDGVELTEELEKFAVLVRAEAIEEAARLIDETWLASPCEYAEAIRALVKPPAV